MPHSKLPPWSRAKLRVSWGEVPPFGAVLRFASGRQYQVIAISGRSLTTIVLPDGASTADALVLDWRWAPRKRKGRR